MPNYIDGTQFIRDIFRYGTVRRSMTVGYEHWLMMAESGSYLVDATEEEPTLRYVHPWGEFIISYDRQEQQEA